MNYHTVAVIGTGISGLSCARALTDAGLAVTLFEKSRSLGGRCSSRRWEGHIVDHGAQYFTIRDAAFEAEVMLVCGNDLRTLEAPILDENGDSIPMVSPRWYHIQGNNRLGKALTTGLTIRMEKPVIQVESKGDKWLVDGEPFDAVVSSAPWPQTLALLGQNGAGLDIFAPCLTAFFAYNGDWTDRSADAYAMRDRAAALAWSACENHKTGRIASGQTVFVAQASPDFSREYLEAEPAEWSALLQAELEEKWGLPKMERNVVFTHRWRYASLAKAPKIEELPAGFFVTGDCRTESRIESAWLAGRLTAGEVLQS